MTEEIKKLDCPICGSKESLTEQIITETFTYEGESIEIPDYKVNYCTGCGESIIDLKTMRSSGEKLRKFIEEINLKKLKLSGEQLKTFIEESNLKKLKRDI